jgi:hypothetical protein
MRFIRETLERLPAASRFPPSRWAQHRPRYSILFGYSEFHRPHEREKSVLEPLRVRHGER